jgi:SNF2 family DNA or RNA helicase
MPVFRFKPIVTVYLYWHLYSFSLPPKETAIQERVDFIIQQSAKLDFMFKLLPNLQAEQHRVLIFSQSTRMLDTIQFILDRKGYTFSRMDGSVSSPKERQNIINNFNNDKKIFCMLLTTQVGGLGITLTGADRAIICKFIEFTIY